MTPDAWLESLPARHAAAMTRPEFLKAIRALSARYVERRGALPDCSPLDSAGKRAAFAAFYAPLHFITAQQLITRIGVPPRITSLIDAGCGTGVAGAACALAARSQDENVDVTGIDLNSWALDEARETWRALDLVGRTARADFVARLEQLTGKPTRNERLQETGIICGWSMNELDARGLDRAGRAIDTLASRGARILIIEPISRSAVPWWDTWTARARELKGRAAEWRFADALPPFLAALSDEAGFARAELTARTLAFNWPA
jgi:SAM-dependent methyltransferase